MKNAFNNYLIANIINHIQQYYYRNANSKLHKICKAQYFRLKRFFWVNDVENLCRSGLVTTHRH